MVALFRSKIEGKADRFMIRRKLSFLTFVGLCVCMVGCLAACGSPSEDVTEYDTTKSKTSSFSQDPFSSSEDQPSIPVFDFETKTVRLNSGYEMPIVGLGTYTLSDEECYNSVTALLENGGRLIDTAFFYGNEESVGRAIRDSDVPREEIFVTTKLYPTQFSDPEAAIEESLEKLDIGYIDLLLLHHPGTNDVETYHAMEQAVADEKVHSIGLSNWYVDELEEFLPQVKIKPAVVQNEIHPYYQEQAVIPYIQELGIVVNGYSPFGGRGYVGEMLKDELISSIAETHDVTSAQVILRWNLQRGVVVNPGSSNRSISKKIWIFLDLSFQRKKWSKSAHWNEVKSMNGIDLTNGKNGAAPC